MTLMHFLVGSLDQNYPKLLNVCKELSHLSAARMCDMTTMEAELQRLTSGIHNIKSTLEKDFSEYCSNESETKESRKQVKKDDMPEEEKKKASLRRKSITNRFLSAEISQENTSESDATSTDSDGGNGSEANVLKTRKEKDLSKTFFKKMETFVSRSQVDILSLKAKFKSMEEAFKACASYFGEEKSTPTELFTQLHGFISAIDEARLQLQSIREEEEAKISGDSEIKGLERLRRIQRKPSGKKLNPPKQLTEPEMKKVHLRHVKENKEQNFQKKNQSDNEQGLKFSLRPVSNDLKTASHERDRQSQLRRTHSETPPSKIPSFQSKRKSDPEPKHQFLNRSFQNPGSKEIFKDASEDTLTLKKSNTVSTEKASVTTTAPLTMAELRRQRREKREELTIKDQKQRQQGVKPDDAFMRDKLSKLISDKKINEEAANEAKTSSVTKAVSESPTGPTLTFLQRDSSARKAWLSKRSTPITRVRPSIPDPLVKIDH